MSSPPSRIQARSGGAGLHGGRALPLRGVPFPLDGGEAFCAPGRSPVNPVLRLVRGATTHTRRGAAVTAEDLAGRLIQAQEDERKRIAMELHDDLNQKLAALAIGLTHLDDQLGAADPGVREQLGALEELATSLSDEVRQLSHRLHPASVQHAGLVAGLRSVCAAFAKERGLSLETSLPDLVRTPPTAIALPLYRIAQEALQNARKHSHSWRRASP